MRYKLGELLALRDDVEPTVLAGKAVVIESYFGATRYQVTDGFIIEEDMIDYESTNTLNGYPKEAKNMFEEEKYHFLETAEDDSGDKRLLFVNYDGDSNKSFSIDIDNDFLIALAELNQNLPY